MHCRPEGQLMPCPWGVTYRGAPAWCGRSGPRSRGSTPGARPRARTPGTGNPRGGPCAAPGTRALSPRTRPQRGCPGSCGTAAGSPGLRNLHPPAETVTASPRSPLELPPLCGGSVRTALQGIAHKGLHGRKCALQKVTSVSEPIHVSELFYYS